MVLEKEEGRGKGGGVDRRGERREVIKKRRAANSAHSSSRANSHEARASFGLGLISISILKFYSEK